MFYSRSYLAVIRVYDDSGNLSEAHVRDCGCSPLQHGSGRTAACHVLISESRNYRRLVSKGFEEVYERAEPSLTIGEFRERLHSGNIYVRKYYMRAY